MRTALYTAVDVVTPVSTSSNDDDVERGDGPIRFYHLVIVGLVGFGLGATVVWILFLRLGPILGPGASGASPAELKPPGPDMTGADGAASRGSVCVANGGGRWSSLGAKYHFPLPVYPRNASATYTPARTAADRPSPPIDVRQYFHDPSTTS